MLMALRFEPSRFFLKGNLFLLNKRPIEILKSVRCVNKLHGASIRYLYDRIERIQCDIIIFQAVLRFW